MDARTAAKALAISSRKLWAMTASGEIPHVRIGRSVRYPVFELQSWVNEHTEGNR
ncbi:helix-turn-helix domain-containing protein [Posidoniimonas polymericola]|nr:helix-turn-helix domain-containing protein [Posidoniimonas polymericola]